MKPWVQLIEQDRYDLTEIHRKISDVLKNRHVEVKEKTIFLKVSFVFPVRNPERVKMIITNPHFIAAVAYALVEAGAKRVYIGDGETFGCAQYSFEIVEIKKALQDIPKQFRKNIALCYLDEVQKDWITPEKPFLPGVRFDYPRIVRDVDLYISLPKLKVNIFANVTLSVKNNMGLICQDTRLRYHSNNLHELIADLYRVRPPDYVITDAIYAGEGQGPMEATPYPTNLILFGNNGPAVDVVCCNLMGYDPEKIRHLKLLIDAGYGPHHIDQIDLLTPDIFQKHQHPFVHPCLDLGHDAPNIRVYQGECCDSGCLPFVRAILDGYGLRQGWASLGDLTILVGKNVQIPETELLKLKQKKNQVLIYGDCVKQYKEYGVFYEGCPPNYLYVLLSLPVRTKLGNSPWTQYVEKGLLLKTLFLHRLRLLGGLKYKNLK